MERDRYFADFLAMTMMTCSAALLGLAKNVIKDSAFVLTPGIFTTGEVGYRQKQ